MFKSATKIAEAFTRPVIVSARHASGQVSSGIGTFIILNNDGWILTCYHMLDIMLKSQRDASESADRDKRITDIQADPSLTPARKNALIKKIPLKQEWITNHSYWWGQDGATIIGSASYPLADLALCRLAGFDTSAVPNFPVFGNPAKGLRPGAFLCKLGFPFSSVASTWDPVSGRFELPPGTLPLPLFPLEGMHTRIVNVIDTTNAAAKFVETSTPGLRGQSGGPTFDVDGVVWALQSQTITRELGFEASVVRNGKKVVEHQMMSLGLGAHVEEIVRFAQANNVAIDIQP